MYPNLSAPLSDQQIRLNKIKETKYYFVAAIKEREIMSKRCSKYIASFDYFDKSLIALSVTTGSISIASFATVIGAPAEIQSGIFNFYRNCKKTIKNNKKQEEKLNKSVTLARCKLNTIESKISEALISNKISHEDFMTIINEEKNIEN